MGVGLLPFERFTLHSNLRPDDILYRLRENVEPERTFRFRGFLFSGNGKPYEGSVNQNGTFSIKRLINYRNSFLPVIEGVVEHEGRGSRVKVKMRLNTFVLVFIAIWLGVVGIVSIAMLIGALNSGILDRGTFIPLGMFLFGAVMTVLAFKFESTRSKKDLAELLQGYVEEE